MRVDVEFTSLKANLRGWLYTAGPRKGPVIIMAHGFSATRHMAIDQYAECFAAAGVHALLYDHRGFGASEGEPRQLVNPWVQARGYLDAIDYASGLDIVDSSKIAIWGDSNSAGVAAVVAASTSRVSAVVLQVPSFGATLPPTTLMDPYSAR